MVPFKHIFFQALTCCNMSRSMRKYDDVLKMVSLYEKVEIRPLFCRSRSTHLEAKRSLPSISMTSVGYLITLCWLSCPGSCQSAGFWESAFQLQWSPSHHLGFHFVCLKHSLVTTVWSHWLHVEFFIFYSNGWKRILPLGQIIISDPLNKQLWHAS